MAVLTPAAKYICPIKTWVKLLIEAGWERMKILTQADAN